VALADAAHEPIDFVIYQPLLCGHRRNLNGRSLCVDKGKAIAGIGRNVTPISA
jgi:hypothetical protein